MVVPLFSSEESWTLPHAVPYKSLPNIVRYPFLPFCLPSWETGRNAGKHTADPAGNTYTCIGYRDMHLFIRSLQTKRYLTSSGVYFTALDKRLSKIDSSFMASICMYIFHGRYENEKLVSSLSPSPLHTKQISYAQKIPVRFEKVSTTYCCHDPPGWSLIPDEWWIQLHGISMHLLQLFLLLLILDTGQ